MEVVLKDCPIKGDIISFGTGNTNVPGAVRQICGDNHAVTVQVVNVYHKPTHSHFLHDPEIDIDVEVMG